MNSQLQDFLKQAEERFDLDSSDMTYVEWLNQNTTLRGKPFSTKGYEFQDAIINDMHPNMDVIKCSQIGMTEVQMRKALAFLVRNKGLSAIFSLPNEKMYQRVSKTRFKPLVDKEEVFNKSRDSGSVRSMGLMQFQDSFLYLSGCTEGDATSIPADAVFNDELDLSPQEIIALYQSRLQGSAWRISQRFGTPTFPNYGIDLGFRSSDQHYYLTRCMSCNHWNHIEFSKDFIEIPNLPENIQNLTDLDQEILSSLPIDEAYVKCEKCHSALDLDDPKLREWVPAYSERKHARGYQISPFATPHLTPSYILTQLLQYKQRENLRGFYNTVLGLPYTDGNIQLEREDINKCFTGVPTVPEIDKQQPVVVGIDMGQTCHITIGNGTSPEAMHVFDWRAVHVDDVVAEVERICQDHMVIAGAVDRHPYEPTADDIFRASNGRIVPTEYRGTKEVNLVATPTGEGISHAQVDRTKMLDEVVRYVRRHPGGLTFSGYHQWRETIVTHLRDMIRDEQPDQPAKWVKLSNNDHFFHALGFMIVSLKIKQVESIKNRDEVRSVFSISSVDLPERDSYVYGKGKSEYLIGI